METSFAQFDNAPCPACQHPVSSKRHASRCTERRRRGVIEVRPPKKARKDRRARHEVEPEFFPLVSAAHEFKTPLVAMLGYTDLLRSARLGPVNETQRRVLGEIQESAERLQKLIQDL